MAKTQTVTTVSQPSAEAKQIMQTALPFAQKFAEQGLGPAPTAAQTIAPFTQTQQTAQNMALGGAGAQQQVASDALGASGFLLGGDAMDPNSNPALRETIDYATAPIWEGLTETALPAIRGGANQVGQLGGSRQGIAEAQAIRDATRTAGGISASIANEGYKTGLDAMTKALGLAPSTTSVQTQPAATYAAVGGEQQAMEQAIRDANVGAQQADELRPLTMAQALLGLTNQVPGGSNATTSPKPKEPSDWEKALGIASMGGGVALSAIPFLG